MNQGLQHSLTFASVLVERLLLTVRLPGQRKPNGKKRNGLTSTSGSYRSFLEEKGKQSGQIAYGLRNMEWLRDLATQFRRY